PRGARTATAPPPRSPPAATARPPPAPPAARRPAPATRTAATATRRTRPGVGGGGACGRDPSSRGCGLAVGQLTEGGWSADESARQCWPALDACGPPSPPTSLGQRVGVRGAFASSLPTQATKRFRAAAAARATFLCLARETWPKERPPRWRALRPSMGSGCAGGLRGFSTAHPCTGEKLARIHASHPADFPPPARRAIGAPVKAARSRRALGRSRCAAAEAQRGALLIGITYGHAKHAIS